MPRKRAKKTVKEAAVLTEDDIGGDNLKKPLDEKQGCSSTDQEVERKIAAIRAIRDVQIEHLLTGLRLLRSHISEEQMGNSALQFFNESLSGVEVGNGEEGMYEVRWKDKDGNLFMNHSNGGDVRASLLHQLSIAYSDGSAVLPNVGGLEFSSKTVKTDFLGSTNLQRGDPVYDKPLDTQMLAIRDALKTPGYSSQRLSMGMTPKTVRLPKPGEMLLSVHGSPLGVYREEDNMEAIHESDEG